jgi:hypothetical protein
MFDDYGEDWKNTLLAKDQEKEGEIIENIHEFHNVLESYSENIVAFSVTPYIRVGSDVHSLGSFTITALCDSGNRLTVLLKRFSISTIQHIERYKKAQESPCDDTP